MEGDALDRGAQALTGRGGVWWLQGGDGADRREEEEGRGERRGLEACSTADEGFSTFALPLFVSCSSTGLDILHSAFVRASSPAPNDRSIGPQDALLLRRLNHLYLAHHPTPRPSHFIYHIPSPLPQHLPTQLHLDASLHVLDQSTSLDLTQLRAYGSTNLPCLPLLFFLLRL